MTGLPPNSRLRPFRPTPFGRYTLLLPLSTGGMGEIYLARFEGPGGFEKLCIIKKIIPQLAQDAAFVERFIHEARTLVKLSHGSIAQVFDMGLYEGAPYLALEYVDGKDLRKVAARARDRNLPLPLTFVLFVLGRVLDALAYAHRKRDDDEKEIYLVHRDISPQNILVSYEGEVKVIDFGLAKSTLSAAKTNPSIILGKFLYMSPEQARHQKVDRRADLYAVGLCLYELVSGRNPFDEVSSGDLMAAVADPKIPPLSEVDPLCPPEVNQLVMKALAVDPSQRFQTAEEFRGRVHALLLEIDASAGPESVSRYMREAFSAEYASERRLLSSLRQFVRTGGVQASTSKEREADTAVFELREVTARAPNPTLPPGSGDAPTPGDAPTLSVAAVTLTDLGSPLSGSPGEEVPWDAGGERLPRPADVLRAQPLSFAPTPRAHTGPPPPDENTVPGAVLPTAPAARPTAARFMHPVREGDRTTDAQAKVMMPNGGRLPPPSLRDTQPGVPVSPQLPAGGSARPRVLVGTLVSEPPGVSADDERTRTFFTGHDPRRRRRIALAAVGAALLLGGVVAVAGVRAGKLSLAGLRQQSEPGAPAAGSAGEEKPGGEAGPGADVAPEIEVEFGGTEPELLAPLSPEAAPGGAAGTEVAPSSPAAAESAPAVAPAPTPAPPPRKGAGKDGRPQRRGQQR